MFKSRFLLATLLVFFSINYSFSQRLDFDYSGSTPTSCLLFKTETQKLNPKWFCAHGIPHIHESSGTQYARFESDGGGLGDGIVSDKLASGKRFKKNHIYKIKVKSTNSYFGITNPSIPYFPDPYFNIYLSNFSSVRTDSTCQKEASARLFNDYQLTHIPTPQTGIGASFQYVEYEFNRVRISSALEFERIYLESAFLPEPFHVEYVDIQEEPIVLEFFNTVFPASVRMDAPSPITVEVSDLMAKYADVEQFDVTHYTITANSSTVNNLLSDGRRVRVYPECGVDNITIVATAYFSDGERVRISHTIPRDKPDLSALSLGSFPNTDKFCVFSSNQSMNLTINGTTPGVMTDYNLGVRWSVSPTSGINTVLPVILIGENPPRNNMDLFNTGLKQSFNLTQRGEYIVSAEITLDCNGTIHVLGTTNRAVTISDNVPARIVYQDVYICAGDPNLCFSYGDEMTNISISNNDHKLFVQNNSSTQQICIGSAHFRNTVSPISITQTNVCGTSTFNTNVHVTGLQHCGGLMRSFELVDGRNSGIITIEEKVLAEAKTLDRTPNQIDVYDLQGTLLYSNTFRDFAHSISTKDFPNGVILISIRYDDQVTTLKYVNQK